MPITLDAGEGGEGEPDLALANDEVRSAERAIEHWETELAEKVADVQALDRWWMVAFTQILGTRDERVERAVAAVAEVQRKLENARAVLAKAREERERATGHRDAKLASEAERLAALELVASRVKVEGGPDGEALLEVELEIDALRSRKEATLAACSAASGVVASANTVARRAARAKGHAQGDAMGMPFAELLEWGDRLGLRKEQADFAQRVERLQAALREVGLAFEAGGAAVKPSPWMHDLLLEQGGFFGDWAQVNRLASTQHTFESLASDARSLADHLQQEHLGLQRQLGEAEDRREAMLVRLSGGA